MNVFAILAVSGLVLGSAVHVYWAAGGVWPGSDRADLARKVVGRTDEFPSTAMTLGVAALLLIGGIVVGGATGLWSISASDAWIRAAAWAVAAILLTRAAAGLMLSGKLQVSGRGTPFSIRDLVIYSPLTLLLGGFTVAALVLTA